MDLIVSGKRAPRVVYPLLGIVLLLVLACSTAAPPSQETSVNESTAPAETQAETVDTPMATDAMDAPSAEEATSNTPSGAMEPGSSDGSAPAVPPDATDSGSTDESVDAVASESANDESMEVSDNVGHGVGQRAPDFSMTLVDGSTITSADLIAQGQPTFLFFFETW